MSLLISELFLTSQVRALLVVCSAIIIDRSRALACMQELGYADTFLSDMFSYLDSFASFFPCKLGTMALAALLAVPQEQLPASYQSAYNQIFAASMTLPYSRVGTIAHSGAWRGRAGARSHSVSERKAVTGFKKWLYSIELVSSMT